MPAVPTTGPWPREAVLFVLVLLSRLPFLSVDLGLEPDAYRVVLAADIMRERLVYQSSRHGATPLHEIATAFLPTHSPLLLNGTCALLTAIAAVSFARTWRRLGLPMPTLMGAALAFFPIVFVASTSYKDYAWTLCFAVLALGFAVRGRAVGCGALLALAIGCRLTTVILAPAYAWLLWVALVDPTGRTALPRWPAPHHRRTLITLAAVTAALTLLLYIPSIVVQGSGILHALDSIERSAHEHFRRWTVQTGGLLGSAVLIALLAVALYRLLLRRTRAATWFAPGFALACGAQVALYVYNPGSSIGSYTTLLVPFLLLLLGPALPAREWTAAAALLIASPFVLVDAPLSNPHNLRGPILADQARRRDAHAARRHILEGLAALEPDAIVAVGSLHPALSLERAPAPAGLARPELVYAFTLAHLASGAPRYYVRGQERWIASAGVTAEAAGAVLLPVATTSSSASR